MNILSRIAHAVWDKYKAKMDMYAAMIVAWNEYEAEYEAIYQAARNVLCVSEYDLNSVTFEDAHEAAWAKYVAAYEAAQAKYAALYLKQSG